MRQVNFPDSIDITSLSSTLTIFNKKKNGAFLPPIRPLIIILFRRNVRKSVKPLREIIFYLNSFSTCNYYVYVRGNFRKMYSLSCFTFSSFFSHVIFHGDFKRISVNFNDFNPQNDSTVFER